MKLYVSCGELLLLYAQALSFGNNSLLHLSYIVETIFPKLCVHIKDNDNSPYESLIDFLFPVKFLANFAPFRPIYVAQIVSLGCLWLELGPRWRLKNVLVPNLNFTVISPFVLNFNTVA